MMGISNQDLVFKLKSIGVRVEGDDAHIDTDIIQAILAGKKLPHPREVILRDEQTPPTPAADVRPGARPPCRPPGGGPPSGREPAAAAAPADVDPEGGAAHPEPAGVGALVRRAGACRRGAAAGDRRAAPGGDGGQRGRRVRSASPRCGGARASPARPRGRDPPAAAAPPQPAAPPRREAPPPPGGGYRRDSPPPRRDQGPAPGRPGGPMGRPGEGRPGDRPMGRPGDRPMGRPGDRPAGQPGGLRAAGGQRPMGSGAPAHPRCRRRPGRVPPRLSPPRSRSGGPPSACRNRSNATRRRRAARGSRAAARPRPAPGWTTISRASRVPSRTSTASKR